MTKQITQGSADVPFHRRRSSRTFKPRSIRSLMGEKYDVEQMGPDLKRGMVLSIYKAKLAELIDGPKRTGSRGTAGGRSKKMKALLADLKGAQLRPFEGNGFDYPTLVIYFRAGSIWRQELHWQRLQIRKLINDRLKDDFLKEVRIR